MTDQIKPLSEAATLKIRDAVREAFTPQVQRLVVSLGGAVVFMPPEEWNAQVDRIAAGVVNAALTVAWQDWSAGE